MSPTNQCCRITYLIIEYFNPQSQDAVSLNGNVSISYPATFMMDGMSGEMKGVKNGARIFFFLSFLR